MMRGKVKEIRDQQNPKEGKKKGRRSDGYSDTNNIINKIAPLHTHYYTYTQVCKQTLVHADKLTLSITVVPNAAC